MSTAPGATQWTGGQAQKHVLKTQERIPRTRVVSGEGRQLIEFLQHTATADVPYAKPEDVWRTQENAQMLLSLIIQLSVRLDSIDEAIAALALWSELAD